MKYRPFLYISFAFGLGMIVANLVRKTEMSLVIILFMIALLWVIFTDHKCKYLLLICFLIGTVWYNYQYFKYESNLSVLVFADGQNHLVKGVLKENSANLLDNQIYLKPFNIDGKKIKYGFISLPVNNEFQSYEVGNIIQTNIKIFLPDEQANPGGFSQRDYLFRHNVYATAWPTSEAEIIGFKQRNLPSIIIKKRLVKLLKKIYQPREEKIMLALLFAERSNLPSDWEEGLRASGASHLLAISGLHIGFLIALLVYLLPGKLLPVKIAYLLITIFTIFYMIITGLRSSVVRAGLLALLFIWAPFLKRKGDFLNLLAITFILNLIIQPLQLFSIGLQLSYLLVLALYFLTKPLQKYTNKILAPSLAAQLGSFPLVIYYFYTYAPVGLITNIWVIPLAGIIIPLGLISIILALFHPALAVLAVKLVEILLDLMGKGVVLMTKIPPGEMIISAKPIWIIVLIYIIIFSTPYIFRPRLIPFHIKKQKVAKLIYFSMLLILLLSLLSTRQTDNLLKFVFLSVGQGDSIFIELPNKERILVDCGAKSENFDQGKSTILPFLKQAGIRELDYLVISHFDNDHAGGAIALLENIRVKRLLVPAIKDQSELAKATISTAHRKETTVHFLNEKYDFNRGEVNINFLHPPQKLITLDRNENSLVFQLNYHNFSALFTGDLGKNGEKYLLNMKKINETNLLKIAHHGSKNSSCSEFLRAVSPQIAVISVGYNNFGHPAKEVLERLQGIKYWRTDLSGAITIKTDGYRVKLATYKKK